jgi:hypothetical protein
MAIDKKILNEIERYRSINQYITEQAAPEPTELDALMAPAPGEIAPPPAPGGEVAAPEMAEPAVIDVANDPDVEKVDEKGETEEKSETEESGTEELDVTDLVDSQKNIEKKQDDYFENLFGQINKLESRLGEMDAIMNKLNDLETKIEKYQKLSDFFDDKKEDMEKTGKNDYVLTPDQVTDINVNDIKGSFQPSSNPDNNMR